MLNDLQIRLRALFRRKEMEAELDEELRFHIEQQTEKYIQSGMTPEEAARRARIELGGVEQTKEEHRDARGVRFLEDTWRDIAYAARTLRKSPGFTIVAVLTLALGLGANTAIFSLVDAVMLRLLPVKDPGRLVLLNWVSQEWPSMLKSQSGRTQGGGPGQPVSSTSFSYPSFEQLRAHNKVLSSLFGFVPLGVSEIGIAGNPHLANGELVTGDYFSGLGVSPILGRTITDQDEKSGAPPAAVISYGFWSREFGRSRSAVGQDITVDGVAFTIVGVAPPQFFGVQPGRAVDVWVPFVRSPKLLPYGADSTPGGQPLFASRNWWWLTMMGRLKPGVSRRQANAQLDVPFQQSVLAGLAKLPKPGFIPHMDIEFGGRGLTMLREQFSQPLRILMILVGLVLLVACASVATLLVARSESRRKEIALRVSLGAPRRRVLRQLLTESVLLAGIGGVLGLLLAWWGSRALLLLASSGSANPVGGSLSLSVSLDARVLGFTAAVSILAGIIFGLAPALRSTTVGLTPALKEAGGNVSFAGQRTRLRLGNLLVVSQVALSLLLLVAAGLFLRTLEKLEGQNIGFNQNHLLLFAMDPTTHGYKDQRLIDLYSSLLARFQALPGVKGATMSAVPLISGTSNHTNVSISGYKPRPGTNMGVDFNMVGPSFFSTMGIRMLLGRGIGWGDTDTAPKIAVVNTDFSRQILGGRNPIGYQFKFVGLNPSYRIVGVVQNAKYSSLRRQVGPTVYIPYSQQPFPPGSTYFELRTAGDPLALVSAVRSTVHNVDPTLPVAEFKTQTQQIAESLMQQRLFAQLSSFFGGLALLLACIGLYGLMAFAVSRRSHEIGIRMALGAQRSTVFRLVVGQGLTLTIAGVLIGAIVSLGLTRYLGNLLYGVKPADPTTFLAVSLILIAVSLLACYIPARRAMRIDPAEALRHE